MRYFRVHWFDAEGIEHFSDPITQWTDAEIYRLTIGKHASILRY